MPTDNHSTDQPSPAESSGGPRRRSGFCCGCLVASTVLSLVFILLLVMLFSSPEEIIARANRSLGRADTVDQAAVQLTEAQMQAVRGTKPKVTIQLSDADVNAYLSEHADEVELPSGLADPKVAFGEDYVEGSVRTKVGFLPVRARVRLVPEVKDGALILHVAKMRAGKIALPGHFRKQLSETLKRMIERKLVGSGVELRSIEVRPGVLTITAVLGEPSG